ncbi:MAG: Stk1 family PASTA domain-containing Ser/Thr kinase [Lachnospiraceae bacterium]|nr:Stk1 family PASTA domain-containing Ser/Thr kinase [Lachnospiraceae bacterium]
MIKLGMLIGNRYEVLEKIGTGGMSDVYKAKDQKLNRFVAVKVLKQEFSENRNFVSKFRVEAQAAAGLMHPNIVNVYDVGEEEGIHYIVMELVEGITLKKYIEKKVRLTTKEAISIAIQVAMGIEAAHNNHIIHRDIKPQNIIISKEGKVKVTDFGIAKAASSNTITSNVMGSVHYTSPEQARGGFSDEKSDIYSLGVTIFEMLTGRVPFNGDTTVAIAIKHIQNPMPLMRDFVPEIPQSVENIVMKCTQKSPDRRYQSMAEMIADLKHSLINPDAVIAQVDTEDEAGQTKIVPPSSNTQSSLVSSQATSTAPAPEPIPMPAVLDTVWEDRVPRREIYADEEELEAIPDQMKSLPSRRKNNNQNYSNYDNADSYDDPYYEEDYYGEAVAERPTRSNRQKTSKASDDTRSGSKNKEKKSTQKNKKNKTKQNKEKQGRPSREYDYYEEDYAQETVNRQNVRDGGYEYDNYNYPKNLGKNEYDYNPRAERLTTVLTVIAAVVIGCILLYFVGQATGIFEQIGGLPSQGQNSSDDVERAVMPEFEGHDIDEVKTALNSVGLGCKTTFIETTQYAKNQVISAALEDGQAVLANDRILMNTTIVLTVSAGSDGIHVPAVEGMSEAEGTAALVKEGFRVVKADEYSAEYAKGTIISQSPEGNSIAPIDSEVTIVLSKGGDNVEVRMPEVLGNSKDAAISTLEAAGLVVNEITETYNTEYPEGQICYQSYEAGTSVSEGTMVDLKVSIGSEISTYNCDLMVQAPDDYIGGISIVTLMTADESQELWSSQNVTAFPVSINLNNFKSPSAYGIVVITYLKNVEEIVTDADGNQTTQVSPQATVVRQNVQFSKN